MQSAVDNGKMFGKASAQEQKRKREKRRERKRNYRERGRERERERKGNGTRMRRGAVTWAYDILLLCHTTARCKIMKHHHDHATWEAQEAKGKRWGRSV